MAPIWLVTAAIYSGIGIAGYLAFLMTVDVPMYLNRWRANVAGGGKRLSPLAGLRDASTRWTVTHDLADGLPTLLCATQQWLDIDLPPVTVLNTAVLER